jgi:hypothetical protein
MGRDRVDEEEIALSPSYRQGSMRGNGGDLQQIQKVLLGCSTPEGLGYVPVDEKRLEAIHRLLGKAGWGENMT